jgi:DNA polymerase III subunit delta'
MTALAPWLTPVYAKLDAAIAGAHLPHALVIHGPGGWGEPLLAQALALRLIEYDTTDGVGADAVAHPDLRWIVPEGAGESIGIDAVRGVAEFIVRTTRIAPRKVAVFTRAESMTVQAANALLKTLEEPPANSFLILVTDSLRDLLPTIRSRCRLIHVRPPAPAVALQWVHERQPSVDPGRVAALCFEFGDAAYRVLAAIEADVQTIAHELSQVALGKLNPLSLAEAWSKDAASVLDRWLRYMPRLLWLRRTTSVSATDPVVGALVVAVSAASEEQLVSMWHQLARDRQLVRGTTNPNPRLLLESRLLAWRDLATA